MSEIRQIQLDGVNYDLVVSEDEISATRAEQAAEQAQASATIANTKALAAATSADAAEDAADRAEAIVGGEFVSYGQAQGLSSAQKAIARNNIDAGKQGAWTNPNLLDNPFFTVRQRGDGSFTGNVYGVDRWRGGNSRTTITGASGYITLSTNSSGNGILRQILPQTYEGTYTFSVVVGGNGSGALFFQDGGGTIIGDAVEFTTTGDEQLVTATITTSGTPLGGVAVRVDVSNTIEVVCAKLEKGTVSTLANDTPPDYGQELAKCKYYFERIGITSSSYGIVGTGVAGSTTSAYILVPFTPKCVTTYTITMSGSWRLLGAANHAVSAMTRPSAEPTNAIIITCTSTSLTTGEALMLQSNNDANAYIDLSADL